MLDNLDNKWIGTNVEDGVTPMEEEYDDMIVEEHPKADDKEALDKYRDDVNLKMLEDLDDEGISTMMGDGITPTEEEYDDMIVEEHPEAKDKEALDKYLNMELRKGAQMDDEGWG
jgi:hypothetical protein